MNKNKIIIGILIFGAGFYSSVFPAEIQDTLTWQECVIEASGNNPDLAAAKEKIAQAKADKNIAKSVVLPQISSQLSGKKSKAASNDVANTYGYSVTGQQLLFDGLKTPADIAAAAYTLKAQQYAYAVTSSDVLLNLRIAFSTLLRAQELIALTKEIAQRRKENLELVQARYNAGREHKGAVLTAQADFAEAGFEVAQASRNLVLAQQGLAKALGRDVKNPPAVKGNFSIEKADREKPDCELLANTTPLLKELIAKKEAARLGYRSAKADFFPQVYLSGSYGGTNDEWPPQSEEWSAGVKVSLPIFEGGSRIAQTEKAKSSYVQTQDEERSGRDGVIYTLEKTWKDFQDAIDTVSVQEKFLEAAQERAKIANAQYSSGLVTFDDWIIIENNLVNVKKAYLDAQANLLVAEAYWIQAKGGMLEYVQK